jgi:hypothetical protein
VVYGGVERGLSASLFALFYSLGKESGAQFTQLRKREGGEPYLVSVGRLKLTQVAGF